MDEEKKIISLESSVIRKMKRRELLKLIPIVAAGLTVPIYSENLIKKGLGFSDWASEKLYNPYKLAEVFTDNQVTAFEKFPYNTYDKHDPEIDLESWSLTVEGLVEKAGDYKLHDFES